MRGRAAEVQPRRCRRAHDLLVCLATPEDPDPDPQDLKSQYSEDQYDDLEASYAGT